ncbi:cell division protein DivIB [Paenibacillus selenitireducens]|uniref:Cell division protein DivIB n=1 Tax=Paenibacillus selenitireducens TaxID=1324314 RepID=A0A1T2XF60_9BACL|nr:FtsQ-type POTRA domain-containing protein [Paenibacillus selenitireducens]OPA78468.1 cell division protein DivIB [Paenibacillus selenitireducens]
MTQQLPVLKEKKVKTNTSRKLLFILLILFVVLLAVLFFRSSMSKISEIHITGNQLIPNQQLVEKSGLHIGDQFFGTSKGTIRERLLENKAVQDVKIELKFPGVISISVQEFSTVAYQMSPTDGKITGLLSNGTTLPLPKDHILVEKPILTNWKAGDALLGKLCKQLGEIPDELLTDISEIMPDPSKSYPDRIKMYTRSQFEVLTTISLMKDKVEYLSNVIETQQPGLITMLTADTYRPFDNTPWGTDLEKDTTQ